MAFLWIRSFVYFLYVLVLTNSKPPELGQDDEFFTAASDMVLLLKVETKLGNGLRRYMEMERMKIVELERKIEEIEYHKEERGKDDTSWVSHPINAYGVMKRFTTFWPSFRKHAVDEKGDRMRDNLLTDLKSLEGAFPSENDLRGALAAIVRIQNTYNITASEFITGLGPYMQTLDVKELFQMGYLWCEIGEFFHAKEWFLEAVKRFPRKVKVVGFLEKASLYEYLAWSEYKLFDLKNAIKHTKYVLKIKPDHRAAITNLKLFQDYAEKVKKEGIDLQEHVKNASKISTGSRVWEIGKHNMLCSGKLTMEKSISDKLYCRYGAHKPRFILKPLKIEYAYNDPNITLYHDLLTDFEINHLKTRASPYLSRATVHDLKTGHLAYADYRISKSAWIKPETDSVVAKMYEKISLVTGLDTRSYEPLQIANYGMAGQYEPHFDHATDKMPKRFTNYGGNRLATMLMYLSDVERGGCTVFTKTGPGVSIAPRKGTGAFWYNLKRNGKGNNKTEHAACPVVLGQKWVSNIWIHERHQEFVRKCSLDKDE